MPRGPVIARFDVLPDVSLTVFLDGLSGALKCVLLDALPSVSLPGVCPPNASVDFQNDCALYAHVRCECVQNSHVHLHYFRTVRRAAYHHLYQISPPFRRLTPCSALSIPRFSPCPR